MKPIQIKNINRSENQPIFIKEKILENGETIRIMYQRKNIESMNGFFERIKTRVRYTTQDFAQKFDLNGLKKALGFTSLRILVDKDESKEELRDFKSEMSTAGAGVKPTNELKKLLTAKFVTHEENTKFEINLEKYELNEFLRDFSSIGKNQRTEETWMNHARVFMLFQRSVTFNLMTREEIKEISNGFEKMKEAIKGYLEEKRVDEDVKNRFMVKLDEVRNQSISSRPTGKEMKVWCLTNEKSRYSGHGQGYKGPQTQTAPSVLNSIEQLFSSTSTQKEKKPLKRICKISMKMNGLLYLSISRKKYSRSEQGFMSHVSYQQR